MKYFLIAGEASGDIHGAALIDAIKAADGQAQFMLLGGDLMAQAAGVQPVRHYRDMAYMGFFEVARHARQIARNFKAARKAIADFMPDRLILIDYPSFNLKMAKYAKGLGIEVVYYIAPKVWAWKEWRVKTIKRLVDKLLVIFPFEVDFFAKHGVEACYVGNPSVEEVDRIMAQAPSRAEFLAANKLPDKPLVALLPGSRVSEIRVNLPIMAAAMKQFPQYRGVIAGAPSISQDFYSQFCNLPVVTDQTFALLAHSRAALVTSGTATLETALAGVPQVALFRNSGSKVAYFLFEHLIHVDYVTLPNLIAGRPIITELLLHLCTPDAVAHELGLILPDRQRRQQMIDDYAAMRQALSLSVAPVRAAEIITARC